MYSPVLVLLLSVACIAHSANHDLMQCVFCKMITESAANELSPVNAFTLMYRRCARVGLMEPVCDQFVDRNAKQIVRLARSGIPLSQICQAMSFCRD
uniref:Saposin B-type domain-containing protein n=1 Tax=Steinernema glaseri TaxID=37863 RepID=A0A1I7YMD3_9BILA